MTPAQMVEQFHKTYGAPIAPKPIRKPDNFDLRLNLLLEEASEYVEARAKEDFIEQIDALADIVYVAYGAMLSHGVTVDKAPNPTINMHKTETNFTQEIIRYGKAVNSSHNLHTHFSPYTSVGTAPEIKDIVHALTNIVDAAYSIAHGLDVDLAAVLEEVHRSNMSKLGADGKPIYRETDNKVMKGPNFFTPDIAKVIAHSRYGNFYKQQPKEVQEYLAKFDNDEQKWYNG